MEKVLFFYFSSVYFLNHCNELNSIIRDDRRVEQVMLTVREGVTIVRKNEIDSQDGE